MPTCSNYKHVGCRARADGKYCSDITARTCAMRSVTHKLKKHVLANNDIDRPVRVGVAHSRYFPCGEYSSGGWSKHTAAEESRVRRTIRDTYRIIDGSIRQDPADAGSGRTVVVKIDADVIAGLGVMLPRL